MNAYRGTMTVSALERRANRKVYRRIAAHCLFTAATAVLLTVLVALAMWNSSSRYTVVWADGRGETHNTIDPLLEQLRASFAEQLSADTGAERVGP